MSCRHPLFHEKIPKDMISCLFSIYTALIILSLPYFASLCSAQQDTISQEIARQKGTLQNVRREIHEKQEKLTRIKGEEKKVIETIHRLNQKINHHWALLQEKKEERRRIEERIKEVSQTIQGLQHTLERQKGYVEMRLRALWEFGPLGALNVVLSSHSISELYSRQQYLLFILQRDHATINTYMANLSALKKKKELLGKEKELLLKVEREIEAQALQLEEAMETKKLFLEDLKAQEEGYEMLLTSLRKTEKNIDNLLKELKNKTKEKALPRPRSFTGNSVHKADTQDRANIEANIGKLTPPIIGAYRIITSSKDPRVPQNGILFEAQIGAPVRAIFDGTVEFIGPVKGFGTVVILDHGHGYMSLLGYLSRVFVPLGKEVFEGETIGMAGPGGLVDAGTYLEIRKDGQPLDPLAFIDTRGMTID